MISEPRKTPRSGVLASATVIVCLLGAVAAFGLAFMTHTAVSMSGFPDGYVTDYGRAVDLPLTIVVWVEVGLGVLFLGLAFFAKSARARGIGVVVVLTVFVVAAAVAQVGVPWYFGTHLGLDNGVGG